MANIKSAQQHIKINKRNRVRNLAQRAAVKAWFKKLRTMEEPTADVLDTMLKELHVMLDKVSYQAFHYNKVNRLKSKGAQLIKTAKEQLA